MGGTRDKVRGRVKQAIGALTGDKKLKRDGRLDERAGGTKRKADEAIDLARDKLGDAAETLSSNKEK